MKQAVTSDDPTADITHRQLLDAIQENSKMTYAIADTLQIVVDNMSTKGDLKELDDKLTGRMDKMDARFVDVENGLKILDTKIDGLETRLSAKIRSNHSAAIAMHLETREEIAYAHQRIDKLEPSPS